MLAGQIKKENFSRILYAFMFSLPQFMCRATFVIIAYTGIYLCR